MLISHRATNILLVAILAVGIGIVAMLASGARGGPLDPTGSPASTPGGIDGRIPISSLPFTINASGSYVLTKSLQSFAPGDGIVVTADGVSIDLNGFSLSGGNGADIGISATGRANLRVTNGVLQGWSTAGILNGVGNGIGRGGFFSALRFENNIGAGIIMPAGGLLEDSVLWGNTQGAVAGEAATISGSTFFLNVTAIQGNVRALIEANHIDIPASGTGVTAADNSTIARNYFGSIDQLSGYVPIAFGTATLVAVVGNRIKATLSTGNVAIVYDVNNALTNFSP